MERRYVVLTLIGIPLLCVVAYIGYMLFLGGRELIGNPKLDKEKAAVDIGAPLYPAKDDENGNHNAGTRALVDAIVIHDSHIAVVDKQNPPAKRDGVLLFIGTDLPFFQFPGLFPGQFPGSPDDQIKLDVMTGKLYRPLKEGAIVENGQLLAQLDNQLAQSDYNIQLHKITAAIEDYKASVAFYKESETRVKTEEDLLRKGAGSKQDWRTAVVTMERYAAESVSKFEAIGLARVERDKARTMLDMHEIRCTIPGKIKTINRHPGDAVKALEPVFEIYSLDTVRAEGMVGEQYLPRLQEGMKVVVEPSRHEGPEQAFAGHLQDITGVAVTPSADKPLIVSASEDRTVRVWSRERRTELRVYNHPAAVRAVACTSLDGKNLCLSGAADGKGRFYNLDSESREPERLLEGQHRGPITCVAFSPDGKYCATGGEDRDIIMWETATGKQLYVFPAGHSGAVTSVQFTPLCQLVSAGRDNSLRLWTLGDKSARQDMLRERRSGNVLTPGVSPDGKHVLFDQGKTLSVLSLPEGLTEETLETTSEASNFSTFALVSPDARLILTAAGTDGNLQLWRAPTHSTRGYEIRQLDPAVRSAATCGAFAPNGSFIATGATNRRILIWRMPSKAEIEKQLTATVKYIDPVVEPGANQVRIWAEFPNPGWVLHPGVSVTMVAYPDEKK